MRLLRWAADEERECFILTNTLSGLMASWHSVLSHEMTTTADKKNSILSVGMHGNSTKEGYAGSTVFFLCY
jgi:hypothetical protein